jgi:hypothetical protein
VTAGHHPAFPRLRFGRFLAAMAGVHAFSHLQDL